MLHKRRQRQMEFNDALRKKNAGNQDLTFDELEKFFSDGHRPFNEPDCRIPNYTLSTRLSSELVEDLNDCHNDQMNEPDQLTSDAPRQPCTPNKEKVRDAEHGQNAVVATSPESQRMPRDLPDLVTAGSADLTHEAPRIQKVTDPNNPRFDAGIFFHPILGKFACAHAPMCK
jgi:hypothetical protein